VITSTEPRFSQQQQQDIATSQKLKGAEAAAILKQEQEQEKASQIMAERLPGLIDPKLPPDQQPLNDTSNPVPVAHPPQALHPDRFTPGAADGTNPEATPKANLAEKSGASENKAFVDGEGPGASKPKAKAAPDENSPRKAEPKASPAPDNSPPASLPQARLKMQEDSRGIELRRSA
jgi:rod shape-determining protein MreC